MWELYLQAKEWSKLPSEILFIEGWYDARSVNQAVWHFGVSLEAAMHDAEKKAKTDKEKQARREAVLTRWLTTRGSAKQYQDPAGADRMAKRA